MANEYSKQTYTATAVAITAGTPLEFTAAGLVQAAQSASAVFAGVAITNCAASGIVAVYGPGEVVTLTAGSAVVPGNLLKMTSAGKVIPVVAGSDAYNKVIGVALAPASGDTKTFLALLKR